MNEKEKYYYICDAEVRKGRGEFNNYMRFQRSLYSNALEQFPHGSAVEVYIKIKDKENF